MPELNGPQKAAAILVQLGNDVANRVLKSMNETEVVQLTLAIANLPQLETEMVNDIVNEFVASISGIESVRQGGIDAAKEMLTARLGSAEAERILEQFAEQGEGNPLGFLAHIDPHQAASFLSDEHPQTVAVVFSYLPSEVAAPIMASMPELARARIAKRVAKLERVDPVVLEQLASILQMKLAGLAKSGPTFARGGVQTIVDILNHSEQGIEKRILSDLDVVDPELADRIRSQMFVFEDVMMLDDRTLQRVLRQISPKDLAVALKGVSTSMRDKVMRNLSERASADLAEEIEVLGPLRVSTVEAAQASVVKVVRELESAGEIVLARSTEEMIS